MKAYNNDPKRKEQFVAEVQRHQELDLIEKGTYGNNENGEWKGCSVACSLRSIQILEGKTPDEEDKFSDHKSLVEWLGITPQITHLQEAIFEGLPSKQSHEWTVRFAKAIPVGADTSLVHAKFLVWLLEDVKQYAGGRVNVLASIDTVIGLYERVIGGGTVTDKEWDDARTAAWDASADARTAACAAASAAWAAWAAEWAAARTARAAWAASDAYDDKYTEIADKLIELLEEAPVNK